MEGPYDVIVAGAGPAGATAAHLCARAGLSTAIIEREVFPRDKPCGGGLSARAVADLARIFEVPEADFDTIFGLPREALRAHCHTWAPGGRAGGGPGQPGPTWTHYRRLRYEPGSTVMRITRRRDLDRALLERARASGVVAFTSTEAVAWGQDENRVWVTARPTPGRGGRRPALIRTFGGRFLIGADGAASVVARGLAGESGREGRGGSVRPSRAPAAVCLSLHFPLGREEAERLTMAAIDLHFGLVGGGYGWAFPGPAGLAVGVGGLARAGLHPGLRPALSKLIGLYGLDFPQAETAPKGWVVPLGGCRRPWENGRVVLAGDAAGVANPLTGEGIGPAVRSAEMAAKVVIARSREEEAGRPASLAAAFGVASGLGPPDGLGLAGGYSRRLWEEEVSRERRGLALVGWLGRLAPERHRHLFRRDILSLVVAAVLGRR